MRSFTITWSRHQISPTADPSACLDGWTGRGRPARPGGHPVRWFSPLLLQPVNTDCVDESLLWWRASEATAALRLPGYASVCVNAS